MSVLSVQTKKVPELQATTNLVESDMIVVELADGGTRKMTYGDFITTIKASLEYPEEAVLSMADVVDVQTDDGTKVPAAKLVYDMHQIDVVTRREMDCLNGIREKGNLIDVDTLMGYVRAKEHHKYAIGDYFEDNGVQWAVAARNWYPAWAFGDGVARPEHIVCMPVDFLATSYQFNTTNTNTGGYAASLMPANMETEFGKLGSKVKAYCKQTRIYENNKGAWAAAMRNMRLPTIVEVTGNQGWANDGYSGGVCSQLPLCQNSLFRIRSTWYWCLDPSSASTTTFCTVSTYGSSDSTGASYSGRVRPLIVLA